MVGRKGRRGFGNIRKLPSGRYQASYIGPDTRRHNAPNTFTSKLDAEAWLAARRAEIVGDNWRPPAPDRDPPTLTEYAERWLENRRKADGTDLAPRTKVEYRRILDKLILPTLGDLPLKHIQPETVEAWHANLDTGPTRRANAYSLLHAIMESAVEQQRVTGVTVNPCQIRGASRAPRASRTEPATLEELDIIVGSVPDRYRAMILLAAWCALRFNELAALRRRDINLDSGFVYVRRGVNLVNGRWVVTAPKAGSARDVAIPPHIVPDLRHHLDTHVDPHPDVLVFPARKGGFMRESTLNRVWYPARLKAGRPDLRFHDLRHTGMTYAAQAGATLAELMQRAGHRTPQAALTYQHASKQRDAELARRLSRMTGREEAWDQSPEPRDLFPARMPDQRPK